jgi:hypothetical protein
MLRFARDVIWRPLGRFLKTNGGRAGDSNPGPPVCVKQVRAYLHVDEIKRMSLNFGELSRFSRRAQNALKYAYFLSPFPKASPQVIGTALVSVTVCR